MFDSIRNAFDGIAEDVVQRLDNVSERFDPNRRSQQAGQTPPVQQPPQQSQKPPPASMKAIKKLPTIRVAPEDLIDPNNRECCICLEENNLDDLVTRLPCAHIFHTHCIIDWLANHSCTCPVCRYELPTDYPQYEVGRIERMKLRKPRFAMHELKRMTASDLKELSRKPLPGALEKKELIQSLIDNDWIDIIPAPEPVQYELEVLKTMKISELKRTMAEAGVFFRKEDVLMKSDMITVFENSGRLVLLKSDSDESTDQQDNYETMVHTTTDSEQVNHAESPSNLDSEADDEVMVETVIDESENIDEIDTTVAMDEEIVEMFPRRTEDQTDATSNDIQNSIRTETQTEQPAGAENGESTEELPASDDSQNDSTARLDIQSDGQESPREMDIEDVPLSDIIDLTNAVTDPRSTFDHYTINHLQTLGRDLQIDLSHCLMRREMVDLFVNAGITGNPDPLALSPIMFSTWSVSQLRVVAAEMKVSLSECSSKDEMVQRILHAGNIERPYLRDYLRSLSPLTTKSLADLRAIARELQINIRDCLEKDEIIQRLIARGRRVEVH